MPICLEYVIMTFNIHVQILSSNLEELAKWYTNGINRDEYTLVESPDSADVVIRFSDPLDLTVYETCPVMLYVSCPLGHLDSLRFEKQWGIEDFKYLRENMKIVPFGSSAYHNACLENVKVIYPKVVSENISRVSKTFYHFIHSDSVAMGLGPHERPAMIPRDNDNLGSVLQAFCSLCMLDDGVKLIISSDSDDLEKYISKVVKGLIKKDFITKAMWKHFASKYLLLTSPSEDSHSDILREHASYLITPNLGTDLSSEILFAFQMGVPVLLPESPISKAYVEVYGSHVVQMIPSMGVKNVTTNEPYILVENWSFINFLLKVLMSERQVKKNIVPLPDVYDINNYLYYVCKMCRLHT